MRFNLRQGPILVASIHSLLHGRQNFISQVKQGGAKPPPKSCINVWVVVLFYNNFVGFLAFFMKVGLKMQNVRPIK